MKAVFLRIYKILITTFFYLLLTNNLEAQVVFYSIKNENIYDFLEEMANYKIIEINSAIKPYSRLFIAEKLLEIKKKDSILNKRQKSQLYFFLKEFNKEINSFSSKHKVLFNISNNKRFDFFYYKDSFFTFSLNPIIGIQYWKNENGENYHRWNGAEAFAYIGKNLGIYASLRDNYEKNPLSNKNYLDTRDGACYKSKNEYSEMMGGITYSWKYGFISLIKDKFVWGNYTDYPSIFSTKPPSFVQIKFNLKPVDWAELNYFHGWLISEIIDSSRSYSFISNGKIYERLVYRPKYLAANMLTFKITKNTYFSAGNSIVYDNNINPAFLIPIMFYKSIDHTYGGAKSNFLGQNSQMFFDISIRRIKFLHIYATLFYDELSIYRFFKKDEWNFYSIKAGIQISNIINNTFFNCEVYKSNPLVYKHPIPSTNYESNSYNMGHYLQDNSRMISLNIKYKPLKNLQLKYYFSFSQHGPSYDTIVNQRVGIPFMEKVEWERKIHTITVNYELINNLIINFEYSLSHVYGDEKKYTHTLYYGNTNTISFTINYGF